MSVRTFLKQWASFFSCYPFSSYLQGWLDWCGLRGKKTWPFNISTQLVATWKQFLGFMLPWRWVQYEFPMSSQLQRISRFHIIPHLLIDREDFTGIWAKLMHFPSLLEAKRLWLLVMTIYIMHHLGDDQPTTNKGGLSSAGFVCFVLYLTIGVLPVILVLASLLGFFG